MEYARRFAADRGLVLGALVIGSAWLMTNYAVPNLAQSAKFMLLNLILVLSLFVFTGLTGILSFGHASFMMVAAYVSGVVSMTQLKKSVLLPSAPSAIAELQVSPWLGLLVGAMSGLLVAIIFGWPLMRLSGISASIATLSLLLIVRTIVIFWDEVTAGSRGILVERFVSGSNIAICTLVALAVAVLVRNSQWGLRSMACRDDPVAAQSLGINVAVHRRVMISISSVLAGAGGALYAHTLGSLGPNTLYMDVTFLTLAMLVVGGMYRLEGAIVGTALLSIIAELLDRLETGVDVGVFISAPSGTRNLVLALVLIVVLLLRPDGLIAPDTRLCLRWPAALRRSRPRAEASR